MLAIELLTGLVRGAASSGSPHKAAAGALGWPGGVWLVGGAGVVMIGIALYQGYRGLSRTFSTTQRPSKCLPG